MHDRASAIRAVPAASRTGEFYKADGGIGRANLETGIRKILRWVLDHPDRVACVQRGAYRDWAAAN